MRAQRMRPLAVLFLCAWPAWGQERMLTLEEALALARQRSATVVLAQGRIEVARARRVQAGRRFQENPVVEADAGPRFAGRNSLEVEVAVSQGLLSGRRRAAGVAGAQAALERAEADLAELERLLQREVGTAFLRALAERDRIWLLARSRRSADELLAAAERRFEAGEATALEVNRARTVAAAARAEQSAAEAEEDATLAELQALIGLPAGENFEIRGALAPDPPRELPALLAGLENRPDLRALASELREAEAEILLGEALARADWGLRGSVSREEDAEIVKAGVAVSLPFHNRGQQTLAVGRARAAALRQALAAARPAAEAEVRGKHAALSGRLAAVRELERAALPALEDNEALAVKSFEAGEIDLGELLLIRREILETRLIYLDRLLDAALTRFELEAAAGALP